MDADDGGSGLLHIVVFPWLAFGHHLPFLELSKSIAKRGHRVSFVSTPRNIRRLPEIPPSLSPLIHFVPLTLPPVDGLPEHAEATIDLPLDKVELLKKAFDGLEVPFAAFLRAASPKPAWIIHDFAHHWAPRIASEVRVPCAFFSVFPPPTLAFMGPLSEMEDCNRSRTAPLHFTVLPEWIPFPSMLACRLHEAKMMVGFSKVNASGVSDMYRMASVLRGCSIVAPRGCTELGAKWLQLLPELYKKPVVPVGLLPPAVRDRGHDDSTRSAPNSEGEAKLFAWLDKQSPRSVVYVAFGSEAAHSVALMHELALGLELSNIPFLLALRRSDCAPADVEILPEGFEDRTRGQGVVTWEWIPQLKVIAHPSVGGFLTHCGWSSIIESLQFGHPLILLPIAPDQALISRVMAEMRVGLEVQRDEEDGSFDGEMVANALRLVMVEQEGEVFRLNARKMIKIFSDEGCHDRYVDQFLQYLKDRRELEQEGYRTRGGDAAASHPFVLMFCIINLSPCIMFRILAIIVTPTLVFN